MNLMAYYKNVLNYQKGKMVVLICSPPSQEDLGIIEKEKTVQFLVNLEDVEIERNNVLFVRKDLSPNSLKNINYCLYYGDDLEIKQALLGSGISVVRNLSEIDFLVSQTSLDRIENFEQAKSLTEL